METDILIHARWVIPVEPEGKVLTDYAVAIDKGHIVAILPSREAQKNVHAKQTVLRPHHALIPGLINAHTHTPMCLFRGLADDLPLMDWLQNHIWPAEHTWVSAEFVRDGSLLAIAEMLRSGTTCFNDMYFYPEQTAKVIAQTGIRAVLGMIVIDFPSAWAKDAKEYLHKGNRLYETYQHHPLISLALAPHAPYTVSDEVLKQVKVLSERYDLPIHIHVHETEGEITDSLKQHGHRPLKRLRNLGLVNKNLLAVHATQLRQYEIKQLQTHGGNIVHCPESNLKLASGICPVDALLKAGVNVCIGTDGVASNNDLDMFGEMKTAALLAKGYSADSTVLNAKTVLRMATLNAAKALNLDSKIGSLVVGKQADLIAVDLGQLETQPVYDPISQLIYATSRNHVSDVWVAGQCLLYVGAFTKGVPTYIDHNKLLKRITRWQNKIRPCHTSRK